MQSNESPAIQKLSPEVKAQAVDAARPAARLMDQCSAHRTETSHTASDNRGGKDALLHTQGTAGKAQESLSPTDNHKGHTQTQQRTQERGRGMER